jgi:outer membrane protein assembly factor BamA
MGPKLLVSVALSWVGMIASAGTIAAQQTCLPGSAPVTANAPIPAQQPGSRTSGLVNRIASRERNAPVREEGVVFHLLKKHVNFISGGIAQGAGFTFGLELTTADLIKGVEFRASAIASTKLYHRFEGSAYLPEVGDKQTHGEIWFSYLRRTKDNFYGIGPRIPDSFQTNFDQERRAFNATLYRDFTERLQAGIYVRMANSGSSNGVDSNDIPMNQLYSGNPNVSPITRWAPGFQTNTKILSYGIYGEYDGRDDERGLTKGAYLFGRFASADGLAYDNNPVFQDYGWLEGELDARAYIPLFSDRTSLALRAYSDLHDPKGGSQIPFYDLSFLGGRNFLRGFNNFRFRGNNSLLFSGEVRQTIWARDERRGLDLVVFADTGQVWGDNRSQTNPAILQNQDFTSANWRVGFGGGFQFRVSKKFAFRLEAGASNERVLTYLSFARGF